jgi:hypothetical protein
MRVGILTPVMPFILAAAFAQATGTPTTLRWSESDSRCAFRAEDDGTYRYAIATDKFAITLAMDAQELEKSSKRREPVLGVFLSIRFLSDPPASFAARNVTLEFVKHFHTAENPLGPNNVSAGLHDQQERDIRDATRAIQRHPESKDEIEAQLREKIQENSQITSWIRTNLLAETTANSHEIAGWLLFATKTRWIGSLYPQEEFVLRVPLSGVLVEFPFTLPPSRDDIRLRTRSPD